MGWSVGWDPNWKRDIGYGVPSICDRPECKGKIDRGLSYVCGNEPYGGDSGCGLFFCYACLNADQLCERCLDGLEPFEQKPDTDEWTEHKMTDASWAQWREENAG